MTETQTVIERYMAAWNETDPAERRRRIEDLWAPGGASIHRMLEARGYEALMTRVTGANDKWVRDGGMEFRPAAIQALGEVIRFVWEMGPRGTRDVDSRAQSYLVLDGEGRLLCDYQFPLQAPEEAAEHQRLAQVYVGFWNATDPAARAEAAQFLWSPLGGHADTHGVQRGHAEILGEAEKVAQAFAERGRLFRVDGLVDGHHGAVRFDWTAADGARTVASGSALLLLDGDGLIDRAYTFDDPKAEAIAA